MAAQLSVREIQASDVPHITDYWLNADTAFLQGMGADIAKVPSREEWLEMLSAQIGKPYREKQSYCMVWLADGEPVGHCNVNNITFGQEAHMHLHMWQADIRKQGMGTAFVKMALPHFFDMLQLKDLYCEPYALNPAPNRTLEKLGFKLIEEYVTTPGWINFEQPVKRWHLSREQFESAR